MALPVLDGNQSATTLSSVVTGGEHIVAHSVVSLGATAISNINSAVSGAVVTIPQINKIIASVATDGLADATLNFVKIGGHQDGQNQISHIVHVSSGGAMKVDASDSSVTFGAVLGTVTISNFPATQTIAGTVTAGNLPVITDGQGDSPLTGIQIGFYDAAADIQKIVKDNQPLPVSIDSVLSISGTVTANVGNITDLVGSGYSNLTDLLANDTIAVRELPAISGTVTVGNSITIGSFATSVTARLINPAGTAVTYAEVGTAGSPSIDVLSVQGVSGGTSLPISGTAGTLTTRFGTPATANTAFATTAVTNTSRRYLLIQNVTTGSNVITVGIGFTPTTTQGIQLTAGAGITFESSYIPTGAVQILSSVTASNFTILEA